MRHPVAWAVAAIVVVIGVVASGATRLWRPEHLGRSAKSPADSEQAPAATETLASSGEGMTAIRAATEAGKYLFALFWKNDDEPTRLMRQTLASVVKQVSAKADPVIVQISDPAERAIVEKFDLDRAPMPLILALAPNGAITGGFPVKVEEKDLLNAFATPCTEKCMKALQANRLVLVCVQNAETKSNAAVLQGVRDFQSDSRFSAVTEVVMLNPADSSEAPFLRDLKIDAKTTEAVTAFMVPPGAVIAEFTGATDKEELASALEKASSGCCPGGKCGPGGCSPPN